MIVDSLRCLSRWKLAALGLVAALVLLASPETGRAALKVCNQTPEEISVAIGYEEDKLIATEGWWSLKTQSCQIIIAGDLEGGQYFIYGIDKKGGEWVGEQTLCVDVVKFKVRGINNCGDLGFQPASFVKLDRKGLTSQTVRFVEKKSGSPAQAEQEISIQN